MTRPATPHQALLGILEQYRPQRVLCVSPEPVPAVVAWGADNPESVRFEANQVPLPPELANQRYDLAIVADQLERLDKRTGIELLAGLRNLSVSRMAVLVELPHAPGWQDTDFFALAMQRQGRYDRDDRHLSLFTYDLAAYKSVPDWLNSKYWANPQLFGKYWW